MYAINKLILSSRSLCFLHHEPGVSHLRKLRNVLAYFIPFSSSWDEYHFHAEKFYLRVSDLARKHRKFCRTENRLVENCVPKSGLLPGCYGDSIFREIEGSRKPLLIQEASQLSDPGWIEHRSTRMEFHSVSLLQSHSRRMLHTLVGALFSACHLVACNLVCTYDFANLIQIMYVCKLRGTNLIVREINLHT